MTLRAFPGSMSIGGSTAGESIALELDKLVTGELSLDNAEVRALLERPIPQSEISMIAAFGKSSKTKVVIDANSPSSSGTVIDPTVVTGYTSGKTDVTLNVKDGVVLSSTNTGTPALTIRGFVEGDTVTVNVAGAIIGMGGAGGDANGSVTGQPGGSAVFVDSAGVILNILPNGAIAAGGGGGGAGANNTTGSGFIARAGGGGGAGGGRGGNGPSAPGGASAFQTLVGNFGSSGANSPIIGSSGVGGGGGTFFFSGSGLVSGSFGPNSITATATGNFVGTTGQRGGFGGYGGGGSGGAHFRSTFRVDVVVKPNPPYGVTASVLYLPGGRVSPGQAPTAIGGAGGGESTQGGAGIIQWISSDGPGSLPYAAGGGGGGFGSSGGSGLGGSGFGGTNFGGPVAAGGTGGRAVALANSSIVKINQQPGGKVMGGVS